MQAMCPAAARPADARRERSPGTLPRDTLLAYVLVRILLRNVSPGGSDAGPRLVAPAEPQENNMQTRHMQAICPAAMRPANAPAERSPGKVPPDILIARVCVCTRKRERERERERKRERERGCCPKSSRFHATINISSPCGS
jgi:hypothetical protein